MNSRFGDCEDFPAPQNNVVVAASDNKQIDERGDDDNQQNALYALQNGRHGQARKQDYGNEHDEREHKSEIGFDKENADDKHERKDQFHPCVKSMHGGIHGVILTKCNVLKHRSPPPCLACLGQAKSPRFL